MLSKNSVAADPLVQLVDWLAEARRARVTDALEVTLATVDERGDADARVVVVREIGDHGLTFYSDTRSRKGVQLATGGRAAMVAYWPGMSRQVRLRGEVMVLPAAVSEAAFASRARGARIGYWANHQSQPIADRGALVAQLEAAVHRFEGRDVPRPDHFVVWALRPDFVEFWQRGDLHLHDRVAYTRVADRWQTERLQP
ncbi:pyridoxal 5'-phosphate synthase [Georgenia sp. SYP-B2076]|uniref:pyridoxine/pyridoxamine 5'-phosphate oxidase n=1 Tax=Georgenia sp. SYP-B2076 TaxID=2495881 RepID=UPI000F8F108F|nr:pyridoxal 5'-phosphate synthase [Georgenia sp. SYP-B2076]